MTMRRKLFSGDMTRRRKLFSQPARRKLFTDEKPLPESEGNVVKCMDCGQTYRYDGSSLTGLICTRCGSDRFEFVDNLSDPDVMGPDDLNPVNKAFSEKRRKLFSSLTAESREAEDYHFMKCPDCGTEFATKDRVEKTCPVCGSERCRLKDECESAFSDLGSDELDSFLGEYKGKVVSKDEVNAKLHALGVYEEVGGINGLIESGYATGESGDQVMFSDVADLQRKLFSKLVISVTREFDIDPVNVCDKESILESLAEKFPGKPIMILKRSMMTPETVNFSDSSYMRDSGIESDLKVGYGGQTMTLKDFMSLLNEEYPDAPEDIIDLLEASHAIKVNGGKVLISK